MKYRAALASVALIALPMIARAGGASPAAGASSSPLARGRALFDDQRYEDSIQSLLSALMRAGGPSERVEVLHWLALDYITLQRTDDAEGAIRNLLALAPDYALPETSPRFVDFFAAARAKWEAEGRPGTTKPEKPLEPVVVRHASPPEAPAGKPIDLTLQVDDPDARVTAVRARYRTGIHGTFATAVGSRDGHRARVVLPSAAVKPPLVEYVLEVVDADGRVLAARGDDAAPLRVAVSEPARSGGWILPVAIGGGIAGAAAIVGGLALAGVFKGGASSAAARPSGSAGTSTVMVSVSEGH